MNPEGTEHGTEEGLRVLLHVRRAGCLSVCVASLLRHIRESRASWYVIQLQSLLCMPNHNQPSVRMCHSAMCLSCSGHLETLAHSAANLTANCFYISLLGNFTPVLKTNCSFRLPASSFAFFCIAGNTRTKYCFCLPQIFCL